MGAWGEGSFENDAALDFVAVVDGLDNLQSVFAKLDQEGAYIEVDLASEAIAAADIVACCLGRGAGDLPDKLAQRIDGFGVPTEPLILSAQKAVQSVRAGSELAGLWDEAEDASWSAAMDGLLHRLDIDKPYSAPEAAPNEPENAGEITSTCHLCYRSVSADDEVAVTIEDLTGGIWSSYTLYAHRNCLVDRFSPPHFKPDGSPSEELLAQFKDEFGD
jgi:hypothetical protein